MSRTAITRRSFLVAAAAVVAAPTPFGLLRDRGYDRDRRKAFEALVDALLDDGALPGGANAAVPAGDRLAALYGDSLPRRRREMDAVLDELVRARITQRSPRERIALLRRWAAAGGERRATAARATALAASAFGPADRALTVVI